MDWHTIFINDLDLPYALEIAIRTVLMFLFVLLLLRLSGKKGVRQLTIFEVAIIIALGSAAGDPMFNKDMAILPSLLVFALILGVYRLLTYFAARNEKIESLLEGDPMYIIEDGMFTMEEESHKAFAKDEFFAEMRAASIEHVGQVRIALLETNGQVSFYYYSDEDVRPGLPVLPKPYSERTKHIVKRGAYACTFCGKVSKLSKATACDRCGHEEWVPAIDTRRLA
ncbi:hypothetical protein BC343_19690 [Mucilaginibacter pedocola]|uniref:YetF C-terminal domain-containing protein n=1 Tax=Mucilaginibacter pedocola TaxID=1792845 RepID=A0A1S9P6W2_9SPHI|nr:hypothetical protein BC343_19690 [Mucilaginibacter pedocola]